MLTIAEIREEVEVDFVVDDAESIDAATIDRWVVEALNEHNSAFSDDGSDLPAREVPLVKLLTGIKLCTFRASVWATKNSLTNSQGYGNDRDTPFAKLTKQAADLRKEYDRKCIAMGIAPDAGGDTTTIVQGQLSVVDQAGDYRTPYTHDRTPIPSSVLSLISAALSTEANIQWTRSKDATFNDYVVFYRVGANMAMFDETNYDSTTGVARIRDEAIQLKVEIAPDRTSLRVTGLAPATSYTFIVVTRNRQGSAKYVYSNSLTVTTAA